MSCNICQENNINLYQCDTCTGQVCGQCWTKLNSLNQNCPCCRKKLNYQDPNCKQITLDKPIENKEIVQLNPPLNEMEKLDIVYDAEKDKWKVIVDEKIVVENKNYIKRAFNYDVRGINKPTLCRLNLFYESEDIRTVIGKYQHYEIKYTMTDMITIRMNEWEADVKHSEYQNQVTYICDYCNKTYSGGRTIGNHLEKVHKIKT